jgi:hypothetical protein
MILQQTIGHIKIEERNRSLEKTSKAKELVSKANIVQDKPPHNYKNKTIDLKGIIKIKGRVNLSILKGKRKRLIVSIVAN